MTTQTAAAIKPQVLAQGVRILAAWTTLGLATAGLAATPSADTLLKDADRARGSTSTGIIWRAVMDTVDDGTKTSVTYELKVKGDLAVTETIAPPENKGEYFVSKERNLWFIKPGMKRAVVISARQKLMGPASNADIVATNYYRDYNGKITGEAKIDGVDCYTLDLTAKAKNVTYSGIHYWISKADHLGLKAEFLSLKGDVIKTTTFKYANKLVVDGKTTPFVSAMAIADPAKPANSAVVKIEPPKLEAIPDDAFDIAKLKK